MPVSALRLKLYILLLGLSWAVVVHAGNDPALRRLNEKTWQELTRDKNYQDEQIKPLKQDTIPPQDRPLYWYQMDHPDPFHQTNPWLKALGFLLPVLLMLGVIIFLIRKFRQQPEVKVTKEDWSFSLEDLEEHLEKTDLSGYIKQATDAGNYRLAIRLFYLNVLKELSASGLIHWKKDKTNRQFVLEMGNHHLGRDFKLLTLFFEKIWYGDARPDLHWTKEYRQLHDRFLEDLKRGGMS